MFVRYSSDVFLHSRLIANMIGILLSVIWRANWWWFTRHNIHKVSICVSVCVFSPTAKTIIFWGGMCYGIYGQCD